MQPIRFSPPVASEPLRQARPSMPMPVEQFQQREDDRRLVRGLDSAQYSKAFRASGAAVGALASYLGVAYLGACTGAGLAGALGLGVLAAAGCWAVGGLAGLAVQAKTMAPRGIGARLGVLAGAVTARVARAAGVPVPSNLVETSRDFTYSGMTKVVGTISHSSHTHLSQAEAQACLAALQPGDVVLATNEASTPLLLGLWSLTGQASDLGHAMLYTGEGKLVEAVPDGGVREADLVEVLQEKHHAVALRPSYQASQAEAVIGFAQAEVGKPYDYRFSLGKDRLYCSKLVYHALRSGAPQLTPSVSSFLGKEIVAPSDFMTMPGTEVVAEAGVRRSLFDTVVAKLIP